MFTTGILADIWNVVDFGIEESLDLIQSVGAQSISLRVTSSRVSQLRAGKFEGPRIFQSDGGYFFQPDKSLYCNTRIKPVVAKWLKSRDPLEKIAECCKKRNLELRVRISALEHSVIASQHPECATKTVYGDVVPYMLSASNPDVVEFLRATAVDISNRCSPSAIELTNVRFDCGASPGWYIEFQFECCGVLNLLDIPFDESAAQSALSKGIDVDAVRRLVRVTLEETIEKGNRPEEWSLWEMMKKSQLLGDYFKSLVEDVTFMVKQIAGSIDCSVSLRPMSGNMTDVSPRIDSRVLAHDRGLILNANRECDNQVDLLTDPPGVEDLPSGQVLREILLWNMYAPEDLVSSVKHYADAGTGGVVVAAFGMIPQSYYGTIKKAFRFASRSSH